MAIFYASFYGVAEKMMGRGMECYLDDDSKGGGCGSDVKG